PNLIAQGGPVINPLLARTTQNFDVLLFNCFDRNAMY
ncbi:MAG: hypothetical protein ACI82O_004450, partial [Patiriisocius sp.]